MQQSCIVLSSTLALPFCIVLAFLLVLAANKVHTHTQKKTCVVRECVHKIASREGRASSIKTLGTG